MVQTLSLCADFIVALFSLPVPGIGLSFMQLMLGFWTLVAVGWLLKHTFLGGD